MHEDDYATFSGNKQWNSESLSCIRAMNAITQNGRHGCYGYNDFDWARVDTVINVAEQLIEKMRRYKQQKENNNATN